MPNSILFARDLTVGYGKGKNRKIVHSGLSLDLRQGSLTCLLGPNGAGKSTLLRTLGGTQAPLSGTIELAGRPLAHYSRRELSKLIGLVLTERATTDALTVEELVGLGRHPHTGFFGRLDATDHAVVAEAMELTGIIAKRRSYIGELSDGERQKAMIAKALAQAAPVIILDEPTSFLDVTSRIEIMHLLRRVAIEQHKAVLLSTHDLEQALLLSDRLWLLNRAETASDSGEASAASNSVEASAVCGSGEAASASNIDEASAASNSVEASGKAPVKGGLQEGNPADLIASGAIDAMFGRENIYLDKRSGGFRLRPTNARLANIMAANSSLRYLTEDLLSRYGFAPTDDASLAELTIEVFSPHDIRVGTTRFETFEALAEALRSGV
jgi:iron complex transport system ATP-binding protein